jgi:hypothetical protein
VAVTRSRLTLAALLLLPLPSNAQELIRLHSSEVVGLIDATDDEVVLDDASFYASLRVDINGAIAGGSTITVSCSVDGTTYDDIPLSGPAPATTIDTDGAVTTEGQYTANIAGCRRVRALGSAWGTGSPLVTLRGISSGGSSSGGGVAATVDAGSGFATDTTHDSAASTTGPQVMGVAAASGALPTAVTAGDSVRWAATLQGVGYVRTPDPCSDEALKVYFPVDIVTATTTEIVNQSASNYFRLCSINLVSAGANNIVIVEDDTDTCASPTAGLNGGVTAGEGWNIGSNGGMAVGNGTGTVMRSSVVNRYVCIITSAAVQVSGTVVYTLAP